MKSKETSKPLAGSAPTGQHVVEQRASEPHRSAKSIAQSRDRIVLLSMAIVTSAIAAMLNTHFGVSAPGALLIGAASWAGFMLVHRQVKKDAEIAQLKSELSRLEHHVRGRDARANGPAGTDASGMQPLPQGQRPARSFDARLRENGRAPEKPATDQSPASQDKSLAPALEPDPTFATAALQADARWQSPAAASPGSASQSALAAKATSEPQPTGTDSGRAMATPPFDTALWPGTSLSPTDAMRDQWAFRPRNETNVPSLADTLPGAGSAPAATIEQDLAMVQQKIKALAEEVNAADALKAAASESIQGQPKPPVDQLDLSIGVLKAAASSMRERRMPELSMPETAKNSLRATAAQRPAAPTAPSTGFGELVIPASAERIAASAPMVPAPSAPSEATPEPPAPDLRGSEPPLDIGLPPLPELPFPILEVQQPESAPIPPHVRAIASAIEAGRMDVFLSPIVGLANHAVSHYEVNVRLKSAAGTHLEIADDDLLLTGNDLVAMFDIARLNRAAVLAGRLEVRGKNGSLLSEIAGSSITNASFLESFARIYEERASISEQLVLTMSQAATEEFSPSAWQALNDMQSFGFRFALDRVTHTKTDFAALAQCGFAFVKLDAEALTNGLATHDQFVPADELCRTIAGAGLALVASGIADEETRALIFGFGVLLGQGQLFGGPRLVSVPAGAPGNQTAAA